MIAAILFFLSTCAFAQFGLHYWRASIANTANREISDRVRVAAGISEAPVTSRDFRAILTVRDLTPDLRGPDCRYRTVRAYYFIVEGIGRLIPPLTHWAEAEMAMCARYAAVLVDQHLERNMDCAAQMREI